VADYDRRLQRLEEIGAATSDDDRNKELGELCRKRTAELWASKEMQAYTGPEVSDEEWAAEWEAWQAEHAEELAKARQFFASLALGRGRR
jgi:hypothetical protein